MRYKACLVIKKSKLNRMFIKSKKIEQPKFLKSNFKYF